MTNAILSRESQQIVETSNAQYLLMETQTVDAIKNLPAGKWASELKKQTFYFAAEFATTTVSLTDLAGKPLAMAIVLPAEKSPLIKSLEEKDQIALKNTMYLADLWLADGVDQAELLPTISYLAMRRARIWQRDNVISLFPPSENNVLAKAMRDTLKLIRPDNSSGILAIDATSAYFYLQTTDYATYKAHEACSEKMKQFLISLAPEEILESTKQGVADYFETTFVKAVMNKTLTKELYILSLYNLHEYVRQTTRLAARCIAYSEDLTIRNHFIYHLRGEVNHEIMIERDLAYLGADVNYLLKAHIPSQATKSFMAVQESAIGFYQDPILLLACPLAAEGVSASMESTHKDFLPNLLSCIESYGIKEPKKAAWFWGSHINTDGGDDGHWQAVIKLARYAITSEQRLKDFLLVLRAAQDSFNASHDSSVSDHLIWFAGK